MTTDGRLIVSAPPAPGGYAATVLALNPDGQSSLFVLNAQAAADPNADDLSLRELRQTVADDKSRGAQTRRGHGGRRIRSEYGFRAGRDGGSFGTSDAVVKSVVVDSPVGFNVADIVFAGASGEALDAAFRPGLRRRSTGGGANVHVVAIDADGELTLSRRPASQPYRLAPYRERVFAIRELEGYRVEFVPNESGASRRSSSTSPTERSRHSGRRRRAQPPICCLTSTLQNENRGKAYLAAARSRLR